jgi:hypothetical protein
MTKLKDLKKGEEFSLSASGSKFYAETTLKADDGTVYYLMRYATKDIYAGYWCVDGGINVFTKNQIKL